DGPERHCFSPWGPRRSGTLSAKVPWTAATSPRRGSGPVFAHIGPRRVGPTRLARTSANVKEARVRPLWRRRWRPRFAFGILAHLPRSVFWNRELVPFVLTSRAGNREPGTGIRRAPDVEELFETVWTALEDLKHRPCPLASFVMDAGVPLCL